MKNTEYGYTSKIEQHCCRDLERWLADKNKRERRAKKHGTFNLEKRRRRGDM